MSSSGDIFSLRLVIADFYMQKPTRGLDACYSEFRGRDIKRVPLIRIFGSTPSGQKTCMHVHGVFPYFYIPYESKSFESLNKAIYQIAINVDKAINISLGQGSSDAQHVFKVQLVKGIPFYGYHRAEHQFLKIYMFNPRFVRRAANLLQNGAILGKTFHPHESHVPYILQFMIDYNLYGMSFLHVPLEVMKFRRKSDEDEIPFSGIKVAQILSTSLEKKKSTCNLEVDISSNFILNRFQLVTKDTSRTHTNPGIEAIWNDELLRRQKLVFNLAAVDEDKANEVPALEIPASQDRPNIQPTDSELFYRTALTAKLAILENSSSASETQIDQTLDSTLQMHVENMNTSEMPVTSEQKRTFNLKKLMANAVYPEECTQQNDIDIVDASFVDNHLSSGNIFNISISEGLETKAMQNIVRESEEIFLENTIVDEELVLCLTQSETQMPLNASLRTEDMELLDVLQQLETENDHANVVDLDSSLAPLSQPLKYTPDQLDKDTAAAASKQPISDNESEEDNEQSTAFNPDFSMALDDIDELLLKLTQPSENQAERVENGGASHTQLPQTDGADDLLCTPKKTKRGSRSLGLTVTSPHTPKRKSTTTRQQNSPTRSPRTPKSNLASRYAPLPLIITSRSEKKNVTGASVGDTTPTKCKRLNLESVNMKQSSKVSLRKRLASTQIRRRSMSSLSSELPDISDDSTPSTSKKTPIRCLRKTSEASDLDKTHITCALTPVRRSERQLKVYKMDKQLEEPKEFQNKEKEEAAISILSKTIPKKTKKLKDTKKPLHIDPTRVDVTNRNAIRDVSKKVSEVEEEIKKLYNLRPVRVKLQRVVSKSNKDVRKHAEKLPEITEKTTKESIQDPNLVKQTAETTTPSPKKGKPTKTSPKEGKSTKTFDAMDARNGMDAKDGMDAMNGMVAKDDEDEVIASSDTEFDDIFGNRNFLKALSHLTRRTPRYRAGKGKGIITPKRITNEQNRTVTRGTPKTPKPLCLDSTKEPIDSFTVLKGKEWSEDEEMATELDAHINSFYDVSFSMHSPAVMSDDIASPALRQAGVIDSPALALETPTVHSPSVKPQFSSESKSGMNPTAEDADKTTPLNLPPPSEELLEVCKEPDVYEFDFPEPFYSDPADVTSRKEVGHFVLQIPAKKPSNFPQLQSATGAKTKTLTSLQSAEKSYCFSRARIGTFEEVQLWLKARDAMHTKADSDVEVKKAPKGACTAVDEDSPIKVRRQKVTMMLPNEADGGEDLDYTPRSLTLTPLTPGSPPCIKLENDGVTPLTSRTETATHKHKRSSLRSKKSLHRQLQATTMLGPSKDNLKLKSSQEAVSPMTLSLTQSSNTSTSSGGVRARLERPIGQSGTHSHELSFGLSTATLDNTFGFKVNLENLQQAKSDIEYNYLTIITLEVFVPTRDDLHPDPALDEMRCLFYAIEHSVPPTEASAPEHENLNNKSELPTRACGYIIVNDALDIVPRESRRHGLDADVEVKVVSNEVEAVQALLELLGYWDPDIFAGYEIEMASWGYVMERAKYLCLDIGPLLSRVHSQKMRDFVDEDKDQFTELDFEMKLCGRILLDVWRLMRSEIALTSYTFENVTYHILHKRCPWHSFRDLTAWYGSPCSRWIVLEYYLERVRGTLALLEQLDLIGRTSEMAKLIGIQFYEVLSRGSQFRVESMMLRIAKPKNLVPLSPSVPQRAHMRAPEYLALIMEPHSRYYSHPVIVLDFQSLYPSMIIAYNYCFSTSLGRVEHLGQSLPFEFGASQLRVSPSMLRKLLDQDLVTISPCGVVFVKSAVREGILPRMLSEILNTRLMVKQSMKLHKKNSALQRILHSRQLGLKLMANVTYGYTAANFSGRMPAVEVGDSVVAKGRETLERAIKMVEANEKWRVKVVYGDTDSMFVLVPGRNREQAFKIGEEIAAAVTQANPQPVKLKLEKVYQPCILQTKKRYVGYMYESPDQKEPVYEAKGIETVRRDGCPAVAKMLEKVLRILFETADVSRVKKYVCRQFTKILSGRANLQDLIFAKEFRGLNGYKPKACVPALEMTRKWLQTDPRRIPRCGERVPFIIVNGPPGVPLIRLVRCPREVLANEGFKINAMYYITKAIIPPLNRCLLLIGADVNDWFASLPRKLLLTPALCNASEVIANKGSSNAPQSKKSTISQYFSTTNCITDCGRQTQQGICTFCSQNVVRTVVTIHAKMSKLERGFQLTQQICQACCGRVGDIKCGSLDCPVLYMVEVKRRDLTQLPYLKNLLMERF